MKTTTILLFLMVSLWSCKNTRQVVKTETEVKTSTENTVVKTSDSKTVSNMVSNKTETITEDDYTYIVEEIEELSVPDTAGKQYPTKVTKRVISTDKTKQGKIDIEQSSVQDVDTKKTETESNVSDQVITSETNIKTVKRSQSWKWVLGISLIFAVVGFVVYKLKGGAIKSFISKIWKR